MLQDAHKYTTLIGTILRKYFTYYSKGNFKGDTLSDQLLVFAFLIKLFTPIPSLFRFFRQKC